MAGAAELAPPQHQPPHSNIRCPSPAPPRIRVCSAQQSRLLGCRHWHAVRGDGWLQMGRPNVWPRREPSAARVCPSAWAAAQQCWAQCRKGHRHGKCQWERKKAVAVGVPCSAAGAFACTPLCASGSNEPQRPLQPRSGSNGDHKQAVRPHTAAYVSCFLSHCCIQMKRLQLMEEVIV